MAVSDRAQIPLSHNRYPETMDASELARPDGAQAGKGTLLGMFSISLGAMVVEISLTRVFSLVLYYHYAFLVIGVAMLGLAIGGILVWRQTRQGLLPPNSPARWGTLSGLATAGSAALLVSQPPDGGLLTYPVLAALPFTTVGAATAAALARFPASSGRVYAADLAGAALGTLLSVPLLGLVGGINALLAAAAFMGWGGWGMGVRGWGLGAALALTALAVANPLTSVLDVDPRAIDSGKTMAEQLRMDGRLVFSRWDAFARTDVVAPELRDDLMYVFLDGGAGAAMYRFDGDLTAPSALRSDLGFFPFHDRPAGEVLAIGPGGGKDVLMALLGGAVRVTAVEVNPGAVEAVRRFSDFNGGLYDRPEVEVAVDEGRAYLKRSPRQYDTIYLSLAMTQAAERSGYALVENYLYTVEAFRDYLRHLKPGGQVVFKVHDQRELERVLRTAIRALEERGVPADRVSWYLEALSEAEMLGQHGGEIMYPLLVVRREPYTLEGAQQHLSAALASGFVPLYLPGVGGIGPLSELGAQAGDADAADSPEALSPTTDDRPFFYLYSPGPPPISLALLALSALLAAATWWRQRRTVPGSIVALRLSLAYFACLGVAFMLVEVALIQKLTLFLGHPTLAVTTVLFALLVFGAAGSWLSGRLARPSHLSPVSAALAGALALAYAQLIPSATVLFFASPPLPRVLAAVGLVAPLGMVMGAPLPSGLRKLAELSTTPLAGLAWASNGFASVFGSASAIVIATSYGFTASLAAGGAAYLAATLLAMGVARAGQRSAVPGRGQAAAVAGHSSGTAAAEPDLV